MRPAVATALTDTPVVALLGPRQCGKSTLVKTFAPEFTYVSLDDEAVLATARHDPTGFVAGLPTKPSSTRYSGRQVYCARSNWW